MNIDQKIAELDKHIQYIEKVLKEKQDERYETTEQQFSRKWGWYGVIHSLANGDVTRINSITKVTAAEVFTYLSYEQDKQSIQK